jgi:multidrug resistance efflux pump
LEDTIAREELRLRLVEAEAALKEAEEEYGLYLKQLEKYKIVMDQQKEKILKIQQEWVCTSIKN